jgi:hypothetical protein
MDKMSEDAVVGRAHRQLQDAQKTRKELEKTVEKTAFWLVDLGADLKNNPRSINMARVQTMKMTDLLSLANDYADAMDKEKSAFETACNLGLVSRPVQPEFII